MLLRTTALLLTAGLALAACGDDDTEVGTTGDPTVTTTAPPVTAAPDDLDAAQAALDEARSRWEAAGIDDYTFTYRPVCFCPPQEYTAVVEGGVVTSVSAADGGELEPIPTTVDDVFDDLQAAIDDGVFAVTAEYDAELGYPVSTWIDVDMRMADEEYGIQIEELTPAN
jgi:hypothetical protein